MLAKLAAILFVAFWVALIIGFLMVGPYALAYDINHLVPLATHRPVQVSCWNPIIVIGGLLLSEVAIPVAIVTWILVAVGAIA